ncbi:MAG TPA: TolC family protein [Anaeromyxobacter sp.]|nr:TolC family protein [Anaeromyxobacter sp.]
MNPTLAMALAALLGQAQANSGPTPEGTPAVQMIVLPADATGPVITLDQALEEAGERNLDLHALAAQLDEAQEITWKALSLYLPQVTVSASYSFQDTISQPYAVPLDPNWAQGGPHAVPTGFINLTQQLNGTLGNQVNVTQTLVSARLFFAIRGAKETERASVLNLENGRRQVLFGVARTYYSAAALKEAVTIAQELLDIARRQEHDAQVRYSAGAIAKVGLIRAQIDRARAEEDLKRARAQYLSVKVALAALLARDTAFELEPPPEPVLPSTDLEPLVEGALVARPDVEASHVTVKSEEENRKATWSRYLPDITAFGRFQWANLAGLNGRETAWFGGLALQWTILDGLGRESDIRTADARVSEAKARAEGAEVTVRRDVTQALLDLESQRANAQKSAEQRDLAKENQRLVDVAYRAGTATAVEQADATAQLRNAEIQVTTDKLNAQLAALEVLNTIGSFNPRKP